MSSLEVGSLTVADVLDRLYEGRWVIPVFQREFVWQTTQVELFAESVIRGRPIGMATLWELKSSSGVASTPVRIPDVGVSVPFESQDKKSDANTYAVLDGRQRCTALAMVFGGLRTKDKRLRTTGRFFLNLNAKDEAQWVHFLREKKVEDEGLDSVAGALSKGWMPLAVGAPDGGGWEIAPKWQDHLINIHNSDYFPDGLSPSEETITQWKARIEVALKGINTVQLATYIVGSTFDLSDICEIFEVLNTTGTQVSTVDLIHSFVYQDTDPHLEVRGWIDDLGKTDGAEGWASSTDRPERIAQIVTAAYVGLQAPDKEPPRSIVGKSSGQVTSIKASDLLRTPTRHWLNVKDHTAEFASLLKDFQLTVAGGRFPMSCCPYPATAAVYVGIRWSKDVEDQDDDSCWGHPELRSLFRAYFWSNALTGRYDQGFLSQVGTDIRDLRKILRLRGDTESLGDWIPIASKRLASLIDEPVPDIDVVSGWIRNGGDTGARRLALRLPLWAQVTKDLVSTVDISYPATESVDLHHIFPKAWIKNNTTGDLAKLLEEAKQEPGWNRVDCVANLVPLSQKSNSDWRATNPGAYIADKAISFEAYKAVLEPAFIDGECFDALKSGTPDDVRRFEAHRADLIQRGFFTGQQLPRRELGVLEPSGSWLC